MHFVKAKGILSSQNGMNIYRGCQHGCIYCDSRSSCYRMDHAFEDIEVKENAPELLEDALRRKRKRCMIGTGAMSDPYIPLELDLEYTRKALLIIERYGCGVTLQTKSDRVLRDLDILKRINEKTKAVVQMTLTTADDTISKIIEPNVCTSRERFEALKILRDTRQRDPHRRVAVSDPPVYQRYPGKYRGDLTDVRRGAGARCDQLRYGVDASRGGSGVFLP